MEVFTVIVPEFQVAWRSASAAARHVPQIFSTAAVDLECIYHTRRPLEEIPPDILAHLKVGTQEQRVKIPRANLISYSTWLCVSS